MRRCAAARQRLRPILMTSLAFGLGVLPLAFATGAGSGGQNAHRHRRGRRHAGRHFLGIFFIPLFFVVVQRVFHGLREPASYRRLHRRHRPRRRRPVCRP